MPHFSVKISDLFDSSAPSGGTLASFLNMLEMFSAKALLQTLKPYALSPVPNNHSGPKRSFIASATGLVRVPGLGLLTTSTTGTMNTALVSRTWGLSKQEPSLQSTFYGPNFTYQELMKTSNVAAGILIHYSLIFGATLLLCSPMRALMKRFMFKPGEGPDKDVAMKECIELRVVAMPDIEGTNKQAFGKLSYTGSMYYCKRVRSLSLSKL